MAELASTSVLRLELEQFHTVKLKGDVFHALGMPSEEGGSGARMYRCGKFEAHLSGYQL